MTIPVTTRLDQKTVEALDKAVAAGLASNRSAIVSEAVSDWLAQHGEDAIVNSYRHRYQTPDHDHDELMSKIGAFSASACLAADSH